MSSRYEISAHRFENAAIVACAWVRKCQYLYGQEVTDASLVDRDFPPAVFAAYEERSELIKLECRVGQELHARVKQLRDMFHVWALAGAPFGSEPPARLARGVLRACRCALGVCPAACF